MYLFLVLESATTPRNPGSLLENGIGNQDLCTGMLIATGVSLLLDLPSWESVCTNQYVYIYISINISICNHLCLH